jgi:hypothetical protein
VSIYYVGSEGSFYYYFEPAGIQMSWYPTGTGGTLKNYLQVDKVKRPDWGYTKAKASQLHKLILAIWKTEVIYA